jgi:hypothetical protein
MTRVQSSPMKFAEKEQAISDLRGKLRGLRRERLPAKADREPARARL